MWSSKQVPGHTSLYRKDPKKKAKKLSIQKNALNIKGQKVTLGKTDEVFEYL